MRRPRDHRKQHIGLELRICPCRHQGEWLCGMKRESAVPPFYLIGRQRRSRSYKDKHWPLSAYEARFLTGKDWCSVTSLKK